MGSGVLVKMEQRIHRKRYRYSLFYFFIKINYIFINPPVRFPRREFARYGFLDESSPGTFCKLMSMRNEMETLGYTFANLLFYRENGGISPEVYDVVLYHVLLDSDPQGAADGFYRAVIGGDESTKAQYHDQYWSYTKMELQKHVDGTLRDLDRWTTKANSYDLNTHPRVPLILQHNAFVKETFLRVKANLDVM